MTADHTDLEATVVFTDQESCIAGLRARGVTTAIVAWRAEWAPSTDVPGQAHGDVRFGSMRELTVLAYDRGTVLRWEPAPAADRSAIAASLRAAGLWVEERCRNIS